MKSEIWQTNDTSRGRHPHVSCRQVFWIIICNVKQYNWRWASPWRNRTLAMGESLKESNTKVWRQNVSFPSESHHHQLASSHGLHRECCVQWSAAGLWPREEKTACLIFIGLTVSELTPRLHWSESGLKLSKEITVVRRITTFRSTTDRIYDGGPLIL